MRRGVTEQELATVTGMSTATYWRLEHGQMPDPPLRLLANCALALGVELEDLIEDEWREWKVLDARYGQPPAPEEFWRSL